MLLESESEIEILHGLSGGAFAEIIETRDDDESRSRSVEGKADIAEIGLHDMLQFGNSARRPNANHGAGSIKLSVNGLDGLGNGWLGERDINSGEDSASNREEVRGEDEFGLVHASVLEDFGRVAMGKKIVGAKVFIHFDEVEFAARFFASSACAGFAVADDSLISRD